MVDNITTINANINVPNVTRTARQRAARAQTATARGLQNAGDALEGAALTFEKARQEQALGEAANEALEGLNQAELDVDQDNDFASAQKRFNEGATKLRSSIEGKLQSGREKRIFGEQFERLRIVRNGRVQRRALARQTASVRSNLAENLDGLAKEGAASATGIETDAIDGLANDQIQGALDGGFINENQARRLREGFEVELTERVVRDQIERAPKAAFELLSSEDQIAKSSGPVARALLDDPELRRRLKREAEVQMDRREARARSRGRTAKSELGQVMRDIKLVRDQNLRADPELFSLAGRLAAETGDASLVADVEEARDLDVIAAKLRHMTPAEVQTNISELEAKVAKSGATGDAAMRVKVAKQTLSHMTRELNRDPLSFANQAGTLDVTPLDLSGEVSPEALRVRRGQAVAVGSHYQVEPKFFTDEERVDLTARLDQAGAEERRQMITAIVDGFETAAPQALSELAVTKPVEAYLGGLQTLGPQHKPSVREGFRGLDVIKNKAVELESDTALNDVFEEELGAALDSRLAQTRGQIFAAAKAIYAGRAADQGKTAFDETLYRDAVNAAAGAYTIGGATFGGVGEYRGHKLILPQHMTDATFALTVQGLEEAHLSALSGEGGIPIHRTIKGQQRKATPADFKEAYFVTVGPSQYQVSMTDPTAGTQFLLDDKSGRYYVLDLSDAGETPDLKSSRDRAAQRAAIEAREATGQ